jgi:hypothetical protein
MTPQPSRSRTSRASGLIQQPCEMKRLKSASSWGAKRPKDLALLADRGVQTEAFRSGSVPRVPAPVRHVLANVVTCEGASFPFEGARLAGSGRRGRRRCQRPPALLLRSAERTLRVPLARGRCRSAPFFGQPAVGYLTASICASLDSRSGLRSRPQGRSCERRYDRVLTNAATKSWAGGSTRTRSCEHGYPHEWHLPRRLHLARSWESARSNLKRFL